MRLIDADILMEEIDRIGKSAKIYNQIFESFKAVVKRQKTVDAVPESECKECRKETQEKKEKEPMIGTCAICGKKYEMPTANSKYCSDKCREESRRRYDRERTESKRAARTAGPPWPWISAQSSPVKEFGPLK